ncbi:ROK family protein [archaeon]|jgi:predicted NBD/HSP70 family sugar kinase|nr:ROK family protein [archaeon]
MVTKTIAFDIGRTNLRVALIENGQIIGEVYNQKNGYKKEGEFEQGLEILLGQVLDGEILKNNDIEVGISCAGAIDIENAVYRPNQYFPEGFSFRDFFQEKTSSQTKVAAIKDAHAFALGYYNPNYSDRKEKALGILTIGTGLGAGVLYDGIPFLGGDTGNRVAVELGQLPYFGRNSKEANIGKKLGEFASGEGLVRIYESLFFTESEPVLRTRFLNELLHEEKCKLIIENIEEDDGCKEAVENYAVHLGHAMASMFMLYDLDKLILDGPLIQNSIEFIREEVKAAFNNYIQDTAHPVEFDEVVEIGNLEHAALLGAGVFVQNYEFYLSELVKKSNLIFKKADEYDREALKHLMQVERLTHPGTEYSESLDECFDRRMDEGDIYVVYQMGQMVSMARIVEQDVSYIDEKKITKNKIRYLKGGFTHPTYRRNGINSQLVNYFSFMEKEKGVDFLYVSAEESSEGLLKKVGFEVLGNCASCDSYLNECTAIPLMRKELKNGN